jgi:hypothetical protein
MPVWGWYCLKARSFWFFTPSNPSITFGGFEGESKSEMYNQLPPGTYPKSIFIKPSLSFTDVQQLLTENHLNYPFAVKPDVGMMGFMFRRINSEQELLHYHQSMPVDYFIQELVHYPLEVSVFYYRFPGQQKGTITGFLKKEFLQVTGDGKSTLWELIKNYDRVRFRLDEMQSKHADRLNDVLPEGEIYFLSYALNLSHYTKYFYYGRYDIKCTSVEDLKQGKNFSILEYNGCGAEPHHIYGNNNTLLQAYKIVLHHWRVLYEISRHNHKQGIRQWQHQRGLEFLRNAKKHFKMLKRPERNIW